MRLPPGPPLPAPVQTALLTTVQQPFLRACHRRYGDCFALRINGLGTLVYLTDPEALRTVFTGPATTFHAGEANRPLGPILGEGSLLLLDEDEHLALRKQLLPPFHGDAVRRQVEIMAEVAADDISRWPVGREFPLLPRTRAITLEVILRTVIGVHDEYRLAQLRRVLPPLVEIDGVQLLGLLLPRLRRFPPWNRLRHHRDAADALLLDEIDRARNDPRLSERADVLAMLVRSESLGDSELRDQLTTLLVAGHETTATGLAWTVERLVRNPDVLARARAAADEGGAAGDEYLDALVKESLRVRPVVPDVARRLTTEAEVAGYRLPAGTIVNPGITLIQRDERRFTDAAALRPQRFLDGRAAPYTWLPFGGGVRRCLGATFASVEMRVVLREMLRRVEFATSRRRSERARVRHVTLVPHRGARVVVRRRRDEGPRAASSIDAGSVQPQR